MGTVRKCERELIRAKLKNEKINHDSFRDMWQEFRKKKYVIKDDNGNITQDNTPKNTQKKKQQHFDNREQYLKLFSFMDELETKRNATATEGSNKEEG